MAVPNAGPTGDDFVARFALRTLVDEYASRLDRRDVAGFVDLFVEDGEFSAVNRGADDAYYRVRGHGELALVLRANDQFADTFHSVTNHTCVVDGDEARGLTYCTAHHLLAEGADAESLVMLIRYHDDYVRTATGWRFKRRQLRFAWVEYVTSDTSDYPFRRGSADWLG